MSEHFWNDLQFRVCSYTSDKLICTKYCKTKEEAIKYFNHCCAVAPSGVYWYEIWDDSNSTLLFSTED